MCLPLGKETLLSLGESKNHTEWEGRVLESPTWEHVWTLVGGVCPEVSA